jgi:polar amino acid transport system permease protein
MHYEFHWEIIFQYREQLLHGLVETLRLVAASLVLSLCLGLVAALGRWHLRPYLAWIFVCYIEFFRNVPPVVQFFFWSFAAGLDIFPAALVGLSVFTSTYIAEIIRAGISSIPPAQREAARSSGMSELQSIAHIILPQALIRVIPALSIEFINLIKNSSIAMTIGLAELTFQTQEIEAKTFRGFEAATAVTILYVLLAFTVVISMNLAERLVRLEMRKY